MNGLKFLLVPLIIFVFTTSSKGQDTFPLFNDGDSYSGKSGFSQHSSFDIEGQSGLYFLTLGDEDKQRIFYTFGGFPRYNFFAPSEIFSFSVGAPMSIGVDFFAGSFGNFYGFMFDAPLIVDFNLGCSATKDNGYLVGLFAGGGLNYNFSTFGTNDANFTNHLLGPVIHSGLRWLYNQSETGFRLSYMFQQPEQPEVINGIGVSNPINRFVFSINILVGI